MSRSKYLWLFASVICIVLSGFVYLNSHTEQILSSMANYYFQKNDTSNAIIFYENSFELGNKSIKDRDTYVNLIINSPLNVEMQEKLLKFIKYPADDGAKIKAEYYLSDLRRKIYDEYPDNYIMNSTHNQKIVRWGDMPVTYGFENILAAPEYYIEEIEKAFRDWERYSDHKVFFTRQDGNPNIVIRFDTNVSSGTEEEKYIVAYTKPIINVNVLRNMDIIFYTKNIKDEYFTNNQIYNTAMHEIIHALGFMGHSSCRNDVMYMSKDSDKLANDERIKPSEADINTVKLLYDTKPDISNTKHLSAKYVTALVLGGEREITNAKIREAKIYIKKAGNLPTGYMDLAEGYVAAKDYRRAVKSLNQALELADTQEIRGIIYYNLAVAYYLMNDYDNAKTALKKSMAINDSEASHYLLAGIYTAENMDKNAIYEYEELIEKHPANIEYVIGLTNVYVRQRKYASARKVLKNFIKKNPSERDNLRLAPYGIIKLFL